MSSGRHDWKSSTGPVRLGLILGPDTLRDIGRVIQHLTVGLLDEPMALVAVVPESADTSSLPSPPIKLIRHPAPRLGHHRRRTIESLTAQLAGAHVELLHCLDGTAHTLTRLLSDRGGWPYFASIGGLDQYQSLKNRGEHCEGILTPSPALRKAVLAGNTLAAERVHLIRPGIHPTGRPDCFTHTQRNAAIIAGGDLSDKHALEAVLASFAALRNGSRESIFFIMGARKAEHRLRTRAGELHLTHELTFVDRLSQQEMPAVLRATDALVYPHSRGMLEIEILEAMAAGAVVLAGEQGLGDFVIDSKTALLYDPASETDLTDKITLLMNEPQRAVRLAAAAQDRLRQNHSPAAMVSAMAGLYREHALRGRMLKI